MSDSIVHQSDPEPQLQDLFQQRVYTQPKAVYKGAGAEASIAVILDSMDSGVWQGRDYSIHQKAYQEAYPAYQEAETAWWAAEEPKEGPLREAYDSAKASADRHKLLLPAFACARMEGKRSRDTWHSHSGYLQIDLDGVPAGSREAAVKMLKDWSDVHFGFPSPSDRGEKGFLHLEPAPADGDNAAQEAAFEAGMAELRKRLGTAGIPFTSDKKSAAAKDRQHVLLDTSVKDGSRICFIPFMPGRVWQRPLKDRTSFKWQEVPQEGTGGPQEPLGDKKAKRRETKAAKRKRLLATPPTADWNEWYKAAGDLKDLGATQDQVKEWAKTGPKYREGEIEEIWGSCGTGKRLLVSPADGSEEPKAQWIRIGVYAAEKSLKGKFFYDWTLDGKAGWFWRWQGQYWEMLPKTAAHVITDCINEDRFQLAAGMERDFPADGRALASALIEGGYSAQRKDRASDFWTGLRRGAAEEKTPLPAHMVLAENGLVDLTQLPLQAVPYTPESGWLATAVLGAEYREVEQAPVLVHAALLPAMSEHAMRERFLWALSQAMAGLAGGAAFGAFLALIGEGGSGKGWSIRYAQQAFGQLCVGAMPSALLNSSEVNSGLAEILAAEARLVTLGEVGNLDGADRIANMITGTDTVSARKPYGALIGRQLRCAIMYSCPQVPTGDMSTGAWRRLMPLYLPGKVLDRVGPEGCRDKPTEEQVAALLYLLLQRAARLHAGEKPEVLYTEPESTVDYAREADVLIDWLYNLPVECSGKPTRDAYEQFRLERPEGRMKYGSQQKFTRSINTAEVLKSTGWYISRDHGTGTPYAGNRENRLFTSRLYKVSETEV